MATLYIRLPSRACAADSDSWKQLPMAFAMTDASGRISAAGIAGADERSRMASQSHSVVLILGAADVTILRMAIPKMSSGQLRQALPGLTEDYLLVDPAHCIFKSELNAAGQLTAAIADSAWINTIVDDFQSRGATNLMALPAPLCIAPASDQLIAIVSRTNDIIDIALRNGSDEAFGFTLCPSDASAHEREVLETLLRMARGRPLTVAVPAGELDHYRQAQLFISGDTDSFHLCADDWRLWFGDSTPVSFNFITELQTKQSRATTLKGWRTPLTIASLVLSTNLIALNADWWRMQQEAQTLRAAMTKQYQRSFPAETVIIDPLAQMQQKQQRAAGAGSSEFTSLLAHFGQAWQSSDLPTPLLQSVVGLDYRNTALNIEIRAGASLPLDKIRDALKSKKIELIEQPPKNGGMVWQIRALQ